VLTSTLSKQDGLVLIWMLACSWLQPPPAADRLSTPELIALITVDTWRADHLSPQHTTEIWALAEAGERYTQAWSPIGLTTPSHASMLTGLAPWEHGVEGNNHHGYTLDARHPTLPERYEGWATGAFVSAYPAGPEGGMRRGWDVFDGPEVGERSGQETVRRALDWLPKDQPALLWVHIYEPHGPYLGTGATERERYAEEVVRADAALQPLLDRLKARKARIVITSDHGEALDEERCSYQHERSTSEHVLRVPLVRWGVGVAPQQVDSRVGLMDIPELLAGGTPDARTLWLAESGMCEPDCAPGCAPVGLLGRDRVAIDNSGRLTDRPGRGRLSQGAPAAALAEELTGIPPVRPPAGPGSDAAESLGYLDPL
jgi:hypothetical protein